MAEIDSTYQNAKVGMRQEADLLYVKNDGYFKFFDVDLTGTQLKYLVWSKSYQTTITGSATGVLSIVNLPSAGVIILSVGNACSNASAWMTSTSAVVGAEIEIFLRGAGNVGSVLVSTSGVTLIGLHSGEISSFILHESAPTESMAYIRLLCTDTDTWSVIDRRGDVIEQGLA